jgi:hypothetical protein
VDAELLHVIEIESLEPAAEFTKPLATSRNFDPINLPTSKGGGKVGKGGAKGKKMEHVDRLHAIRLCVRDSRTGRKSIEVRTVCEIYYMYTFCRSTPVVEGLKSSSTLFITLPLS